MAQTILRGEPRTETGKGGARKLRRDGRIPAVVYGHTEPVHFSVSSRDFFKTFNTVSESTIVTLEVGSSHRDVLIKEYDEDITTGNIVHLDFYEVEKGKKLRTHVAIELTGSPAGVREGGILDHNLHQVEIECLPKDIPEHIVIDVSGLGRDESIHVSDIVLSEGVRILTAPEQTIASIVMPRAEVEAEEGDDEGAGEVSAE
ncbi:large subunit ribosomal protein L25 [Alkalispirochaeta americana]|uniref:Large ribosomal subunit protein bL25 n=1 Tax=Alkalispirochaeta americana TaxID=159291 RepID=A0A1N6R0K9_9SPIO|nr:50S ribosomal protein L25 [Alkalispirochaeta americana]SIQ22136.1 large subunit ribosomal protein L25 [Alkalispirochaeta americana]